MTFSLRGKTKNMIDQLMNLVRQNAGDEIVKNPSIPDQYNDEAIREVGNEIDNGFRQEARQGNVQNMVSTLKGNSSTSLTGNPMVKNIIENITAKFAARFGVSHDVANRVAAGLVPKVLNQFINKTNDPDDRDFDLEDVLKNFTGNSNIGDLLGHFTGGDKGGLDKAVGGFFGNKK